jgi:hypothetical protein
MIRGCVPRARAGCSREGDTRDGLYDGRLSDTLISKGHDERDIDL